MNNLNFIVVNNEDLYNYLMCISKFLNVNDKKTQELFEEIIKSDYITEVERVFIIDIKECNKKLLIKRAYRFKSEQVELFDESIKDEGFLNVWLNVGNHCKKYPDYYIIEEYEDKELSYIKEKYNKEYIRVFEV